MPPLLDAPEPWHRIIADYARWNSIVDGIVFSESCLDSLPSPHSNNGLLLRLQCDQCHCCFATSRALQSHQRAKHGRRLAIRERVGGTTCHACSTCYHSRVRLLIHLARRPGKQCAEWIASHCRQLAPVEVARLDAIDTADRLAAQRVGKSGSLNSRPAVRADGTLVLAGRQPKLQLSANCSCCGA